MDERRRALERRAAQEPGHEAALAREGCRQRGHLFGAWSTELSEELLKAQAIRTGNPTRRSRRCWRCWITEGWVYRPVYSMAATTDVVTISCENTDGNWPDSTGEWAAGRPSCQPKQFHPTKSRPWQQPGYREKIKAKRKARYGR